MADVTTRYAFPFQEAGDPPDGASVGQDLAEAIDTALGTVEDAADARLDALETDVDELKNRFWVDQNVTPDGPTSGGTEYLVDTVTATVVAGAIYKITWTLAFTGTVTDDRFFLIIREGTTVGGTQLQFKTVEINNQFDAVVQTYWQAGSSGSQSFVATVRRSSGTGTLTVSGAATAPRHFSVERVD